MTKLGPVFLSASVPILGRRGFETSEPYLIKEAVSALVEVVLGRRLLVWGGQPAITPMIWEAAKQYSIPYHKVVQLFQSKFFKDNYPSENIAFSNFVETDAIEGDRDRSLLQMRRDMLSAHDYSAAVFVGGMEGVLEEYKLFKEFNPAALIIPIPTPGGVTREIYYKNKESLENLEYAIDYSYWLYSLLDVDMMSNRTQLF